MNFILLRGLTRDAAHWGDFLLSFQKAFPHSTILTPDLPGMGKESHAKTPLSILDNVTYLRQKLKTEMAHKQWTIVGLSLGGMVAAKWCEYYPKDFSHLILMNASSNLSPVWHRLKLPALPVFLKSFISADVARREQLILSLTSNIRGNDPALINAWLNIALEGGLTRIAFLRQLLAARNFKISYFNLPTLILTSTADRIVDTRCSTLLADFFNAQLRSHPESGHDLALDAPDWVTSNILAFLATEETPGKDGLITDKTC